MGSHDVEREVWLETMANSVVKAMVGGKDIQENDTSIYQMLQKV